MKVGDDSHWILRFQPHRGEFDEIALVDNFHCSYLALSWWNLTTTDLRKGKVIIHKFVCCVQRNSTLFRNVLSCNSAKMGALTESTISGELTFVGLSYLFSSFHWSPSTANLRSSQNSSTRYSQFFLLVSCRLFRVLRLWLVVLSSFTITFLKLSSKLRIIHKFSLNSILTPFHYLISHQH